MLSGCQFPDVGECAFGIPSERAIQRLLLRFRASFNLGKAVASSERPPLGWKSSRSELFGFAIGIQHTDLPVPEIGEPDFAIF